MSIFLAYVCIVQLITIVFFKEYHLSVLIFLMIPLMILLLNRKWIHISYCLVSVLVTSLVCLYQNQIINAPKPKPAHLIQGEIQTNPIIDGNKISFTLKLKEQKILVVAYANKQNDMSIFQRRTIGDICRLKGEASQPEPNTNPYLFNYQQYLMYQDIQWIQTIEPKSLMNCVQGKKSVIQTLKSGRQYVTRYVESKFNENIEGVINALLFGDRTKMSPQVESQYQIVGIVHLLAISGSHISLLSLVTYFILIRFGITKESSLIFTILIIISYGFLAGASASVVRAVIVGVLVCFIRLLKIKLDLMTPLILSCILMLFVNPNYIYDIGFQFSFISSFTILLTTKRILSYQSWYAKALFTSSTTQLSSLPILLVNFHEFSPYSIFINLIYIPFITFIILPLCILCFIVSLILPGLSWMLEGLLTFFIECSNKFLDVCMQLPFVKIVFIHPSKAVVLLYVIIIFAVFYFMEEKNDQIKFKISFYGFFLLICCHYFYPNVNPVGKIVFIDVGQGDCTLIKLPYNKGNYIIDTGGIVQFNQEKWMKRKKVFSTGTDILLPILKGEGISKIDKLFFTHGDYDHIGGAYEVLQLFPVENLLIGDKLNFGNVEQERIDLAIKKGTNIQKVSEGFSWKVEDNNFQVLSPIKGYVGEENHGSIVMKAKIGDKVWMFTGDVDESGEKSIISKYENIRSDVLKVGHHGSDTSTSDAFVKAVAPQFAIISSGANNRYGHPKKEVLDRLQKEHITILRTDRDGAIFYEFKKGQGTFSTYKAYRKSRDKNPKGK